MKRFSTLTVVLLSVFALSYSLSYADMADRNQNQADRNQDAVLHYEIVFDGFCDGMTLDIDTADGIALGFWDSPCATCPQSYNIAGTTGNVVGPIGYTSSISYDPSPGVWTRLNANGTWEHYDYTGAVFNSGTYSICTDAVQNFEAPSTIAGMENHLDRY